MDRQSLPQNYQYADPVLLDDFSSSTAWAAEASNMTVTEDAEHVIEGTKSIKIRPSVVSTNCTIDKTFSPAKNLSSGYFVLRLYVDATQGTNGGINPQLGGSMNFHFSSVTNYSKYHQFSHSLAFLRPGWNYISLFPARRVAASGGETLETFNRLRLTINTTTAVVNFPDIYLDAIYYDAKALPAKLVITFDDAWKTVYDNIFPYMRDRGIKATMYTIPDVLRDSGKPAANVFFSNSTEIRAMHEAGWCIANHSIDHTFYRTDNSNPVAYKQKVKDCINWLIANGYEKGAYHLAYPKGEYDGDVLAGLAELGMLTARGTTETYTSTMDQSLYEITIRGFYSGFTDANAKTFIDWIISNGGTQFLMFHQIPTDDTLNNGGDSQSSIAFSKAKMEKLIDYIVERKIECITVDEWYKGRTDPRYIGR